MKTHWTFHGCNDQIKSEIQEYWAKKLPRVERILGRYPDDLRELSLYVHQQLSPERYEGRLILYLPTGTLIAEETDIGVRPLLDRLTDFLVASIKRHKERLRHGWGPRRRKRQQIDAFSAGYPIADVESGALAPPGVIRAAAG